MQFPPTPLSNDPRTLFSVPPWWGTVSPLRSSQPGMSTSRPSVEPSSVVHSSINPMVTQGEVSSARARLHDQEPVQLHAGQSAEERSRVDEQDEVVSPEKPSVQSSPSAPTSPQMPASSEVPTPPHIPASPTEDPADPASPIPDPASPLSSPSPSPDPVSPAAPIVKDKDKAHSLLRIRLPPLSLKRRKTPTDKTSGESEDSAQDPQPGSSVNKRKVKRKRIIARPSVNSDSDVDMNDQEGEVGNTGPGEVVKERVTAKPLVHRVIKAPQGKGKGALSDKPASDRQQSRSRGGEDPMDVDDSQQVCFCMM